MFILDSGRYVYRLRHEKVKRAIVTDGRDIDINTTAAIAYRLSNQKGIEMGAISDVSPVTSIIPRLVLHSYR